MDRQVNGLLMSPLSRRPGPFRRALPVHLSAVPEVAGCIPDPELSPSPTPIPTIRRGSRAAPIPGYPPGRYRPSGHSHLRPTTPRAAPCPPPAAPASARARRAGASSTIARPRPDRPAQPVGIALDIPKYSKDMLIFLVLERLESTLPYVAAGAITPQIPANVGGHQPVHPAAQLAVLAGPDGQVEVVGHEAVGQDAQGRADAGLGHHVNEGLVIVGFVEDGGAGAAMPR